MDAEDYIGVNVGKKDSVKTYIGLIRKDLLPPF